MMKWIGVSALLGVSLLSVAPGASGQGAPTVRVIVFPGGSNWPIWVAQDKGFLARERLAVEITATPGSVFQLTNLIAGKFDIAMTAIDNVIAYDEGQGEVPVPGTPDLFAFMGGNHSFLSLYVLPEIQTYGDLRNKELAVDAVTTGFAFVLQEMLAANGLQDDDYKLVPAGGTSRRWEALKKKQHAGTLLNTPFDLLASAAGFRSLGRAIDSLHRYEGLVGAARRSWAQAHPEDVVGFIRAYVASLGWLYGRGNKTEAIDILRRHLPQMSPDIAAQAYDRFFAESGGVHPTAALDVEGVRTVLRLRSKYARPKKELTDPGRYYDLSYYERATKGH
jgi:ABC-type nitrate/sulfonate/bicarbonate transport system substrate-binding protein